MTIDEAIEVGLQYHNVGRLAEAENVYRQVLAHDPQNATAVHLLGVVAAQSGQVETAIDLIRQAVRLRPAYPEAHNNLGNLLKQQGKLEEAIAECRLAIRDNPLLPDAYCNLGNALRSHGQVEEAIAACRRALELRPDYPEAANNLANALGDRGDLEEAVVWYQRALALRPDLVEAYNNLGAALSELGRLEESVAAYRRAVELRPDYVEAFSNFIAILERTGRLDEAMTMAARAIELRPGHAEAYSNLGNVLARAGRQDEAVKAYQRAVELQPENNYFHSNLIFSMHSNPSYDVADILREQARWNERQVVSLRKTLRPHTNKRDAERVLRVGYVSPDFTGHPVGRFVLPLFEQHDASRFEVYCYSGVLRADSVTQRLKSKSKVWRNLLGVPDAEAAEQIRADGIDILVDLSMHTAQNRLPLFGRRPAPVQVTYLAYASGTGVETMDYRLTDPYLDPPGNDGFYSERSVRLPRTYWCYRALFPEIEVGELPAQQSGVVTFGCLNNFGKVTGVTLEAWCRLLKAVPTSRLLLHAQAGVHRQRVHGILEKEGIDPGRLSFVEKRPMAEYFRLYHRIDIALDTIPYAGGTTTCDALWMGVPVVSLAGKTGVARGGLSVLSNVGLAELVASSMQEYVEIAVRLAGDLPRLAELRRTLRGRMEKSPLMDEAGFARDVEEAYRWMWREWCKG